MKLIYHKIEEAETYSPFDKELVGLSNGQDLLLVSPYIGLKYLKRLISLSKSWRLISDFQEWIISQPNTKIRLEVRDFIVGNSDRIRHISDIHAKVLITENNGFLGSANFTENGIQKRTEMSVSFSEKEKVEELRKWFFSLWNESEKFSYDDITNFINRNGSLVITPPIETLGLRQQIKRKKKSLLIPLDECPKKDEDYEQELFMALKKTRKSKEWLDRYFDLIKEVFVEYNIKQDSQKITMSITKELKMPISVGQRYIIRLDKRSRIGLILPLDFRDVINNYPNTVIDDGYFYTNKIQQALWVQFDDDIIFSKDKMLFEEWKKAIKNEVDRTSISGFRKTHNPYYYKVVMDLEYREKVLRELNEIK